MAGLRRGVWLCWLGAVLGTGLGATPAATAQDAAVEPAPASTVPAPEVSIQQSAGENERGLVSWYGKRFHGRRTASGEIFDMHALTAAHRTLPFGTRVRVRSLSTGQEVVVRINDRGPAHRSRVIDLSLGAARALGLHRPGLDRVELLPE